jgi:Short C-terminal domain
MNDETTPCGLGHSHCRVRRHVDHTAREPRQIWVDEGAIYPGETVTISASSPDVEEYRVFHQGATGFVSVQWVREDAEQRATAFCERKNKVFKPLRETTSKPPHLLGDFPRLEIVFACVDKVATAAPPAASDRKYEKLIELKKLLDSGVLTQQEFEREKTKILNEP